MIDFNQIFDGVSLALHGAFPDVQVHGRTVKQGLQPGDFNVVPVTTSEDAEMGTRARRGITFDVIFYPPDEGAYESCLDVQHKLPDVLGTITTPNGDKLHCTTFNCTYVDEVLHCIVSYPHFVYRPVDGDEMDSFVIQ